MLSSVSCDSIFDPSEGDCKGDYTYYQVGLWDQQFYALRGKVAGMTSYGFDTKRLCLAIGVEKWSVVPRVEARLREIGIPRDAVYIFIHTPGMLL